MCGRGVGWDQVCIKGKRGGKEEEEGKLVGFKCQCASIFISDHQLKGKANKVKQRDLNPNSLFLLLRDSILSWSFAFCLKGFRAGTLSRGQGHLCVRQYLFLGPLRRPA